MLAAGFHVAHGQATGPKKETTVALTSKARRQEPEWPLLGETWLSRWDRSDAKAPFGTSADDPSWEAVIRRHPQFQTVTN